MPIRLDCVDHGHGPEQAAMLAAIEQRLHDPERLASAALADRGEIFGTPFSDELDDVMRGPSEWTAGERELFAGFASHLNQCLF